MLQFQINRYYLFFQIKKKKRRSYFFTLISNKNLINDRGAKGRDNHGGESMRGIGLIRERTRSSREFSTDGAVIAA